MMAQNVTLAAPVNAPPQLPAPRAYPVETPY